MKLRYTSKAMVDLESALTWYENQRKGLGLDFLESISKSIFEISSFPEMYPVCYSVFRRNITKKFPFLIFYTIEPDEIVIHAIFDNRKDTSKRPAI